jgi:adenylate cyclase class 2
VSHHPASFEVENKYRTASAEELLARVLKLGGRAVDSQRQVDRYFNHPARDFATTDEALRVRQVGGDCYLTYKGPKLDAATKTRREIETSLAQGVQGGAQIGETLLLLGFRPVAEVSKERRTYGLVYQGRDFEIALDYVQGLGEFVELETLAEADHLAAAQACLTALAAELGLAQPERRSYLELVLAGKAT